MRMKLAVALLIALAGCAGVRPTGQGAPPVTVRIIGFNDFHGAIEPPRAAVPARGPDGAPVRVPAGGAAYLATAVRALRAESRHSLLVSAGDLVSASPLVSAEFLDEPTVLAMNRIGLDFNAVGNHEFDRGRHELLRLQHGGCVRHAARLPCRVDPDFPGARFGFLAANVHTESGATLFPAYAVRRFGSGRRAVRVGIIGLTLRGTPALVTPAGIAGLSFADEAESVNALVPRLRAEGADAIVVVIHQGVATEVAYDDPSCRGMAGELIEILARLDPAVDVVVSGHTHEAYLCDHGRIDPARPFLVTSAGRSGVLLTAIDLSIDPALRRVVARSARQVIVQSEPYRGAEGEVPLTDAFPRYPPDPEVAALVARYAEAAAPIIGRPVGRLTGPALRAASASGESVLGNLVADAHLAATRAPEAGGAQVAFINQGGLRAELVPAADGSVTFGQLFAVQPFGNNLVVMSFTGRQLRALLEQQFAGARPVMLIPSRGLAYAYDLARPAGERILDLKLDGAPVRDEAVYRVAVNSFLASGGDGFTLLRDGTDAVGGLLDVEALERYLAAGSPLALPVADRITRLPLR